MRAIVQHVLDLSRVKSPVEWKRLDGKAEFPKVHVFRNGKTWYVGILPADKQPDHMDWDLRDPYRLRMPVQGHIYDAREKRYLGNAREIKVNPVRAAVYVYACLPYKVDRVELQAQGAAPGKVVSGRARIVTGGAQAEEHVLRLTVTDAAGRERKEYAENLTALKGEAGFRFRLALNDPKGDWTVKVCDAVSGLVGEQKVQVQ